MALIDDILDRIRRSDGPQERARTDVHRECRACGTAVSQDEATCPTCGSTDIADIPL
ncbi:hypothetical protein [Natronobeatus ordinarius]|uniref:hypothetical protein n=1 Tax=Natronobeatus ordinarius TaxID=2963433 RepID=UPI0020CD9228|nr:hypothetical protein [Natronobeatus ordinarius]